MSHIANSCKRDLRIPLGIVRGCNDGDNTMTLLIYSLTQYPDSHNPCIFHKGLTIEDDNHILFVPGVTGVSHPMRC